MRYSTRKCYHLCEQPLMKLTAISDYLVSSFRELSYFKLEQSLMFWLIPRKILLPVNFNMDIPTLYTSYSHVQSLRVSHFILVMIVEEVSHCIRESLLFTSVNLWSYFTSNFCVPWVYFPFIPFFLPYDQQLYLGVTQSRSEEFIPSSCKGSRKIKGQSRFLTYLFLLYD